MSCFYDDVDDFTQELRTRPPRRGRCWSCSSTGTPLVGFKASKDLGTLKFPAKGCPHEIPLCPACSVDYMNTFNRRNDLIQGREVRPPQWTVEDFTRFIQENRTSS